MLLLRRPRALAVFFVFGASPSYSTETLSTSVMNSMGGVSPVAIQSVNSRPQLLHSGSLTPKFDTAPLDTDN